MSSTRNSKDYRSAAGRNNRADFWKAVDAGMRRAPEERARAIQDFWGWVSARLF